MGHSVRRHLRVDIDAYDDTIRQYIPGYATMIERATEAVAAAGPGRVLDLGAGTGALSAALLTRASGQRIELWDVDPEMLDAARARLSSHRERAVFVQRSYDDPFPDCTGIMASLSLHHIPEIEHKAALYRRAHEALRPGGVFVSADVTVPDEPGAREAAYAEWATHLESEGIPEERAWELFEEWAEEDTYFSLDDELAALGAAGFEASCVWREGPSTVLVGRRV